MIKLVRSAYSENYQGANREYITILCKAWVSSDLTQFVITHDPELIEKCCDYVMFMDKGGVIDVGTIEEERLHRIKKFFRV